MVIQFLLHTGIRLRQLIHIQWQHIDFDKGVLFLRYEGSKTHREWFIPISDQCCSDLEILKDKLKENRFSTSNSAQVFNITQWNSSYMGSEMSCGQVASFFQRLSKKIGI